MKKSSIPKVQTEIILTLIDPTAKASNRVSKISGSGQVTKKSSARPSTNNFKTGLNNPTKMAPKISKGKSVTHIQSHHTNAIHK